MGYIVGDLKHCSLKRTQLLQKRSRWDATTRDLKTVNKRGFTTRDWNVIYNPRVQSARLLSRVQKTEIYTY